MNKKPKPGDQVSVKDCSGTVRHGIVEDCLDIQFSYLVTQGNRKVVHFQHYNQQYTITGV